MDGQQPPLEPSRPGPSTQTSEADSGGFYAQVWGSPIAHSLSPVIHNYAYKLAGRTDHSYDAREVTCDNLAQTIAQQGSNWLGASLTMPLKQCVIPLLDALDSQAELTGVVNTIVPTGGVLTGANTDVVGIMRALGDIDTGRPAVILGARATASSAVAALASLGAKQITLVARSFAGPGNAFAAAHKMGLTPATVAWNRPERVLEAIGGAAAVVSTLPAGVPDELAGALSERFEPAALTGVKALDVVYHPWPTPLAKALCAAGAEVIAGTEMLIHQAIEQLRLMCGLEACPERLREAVNAALAAR